MKNLDTTSREKKYLCYKRLQLLCFVGSFSGQICSMDIGVEQFLMLWGKCSLQSLFTLVKKLVFKQLLPYTRGILFLTIRVQTNSPVMSAVKPISLNILQLSYCALARMVGWHSLAFRRLLQVRSNKIKYFRSNRRTEIIFLLLGHFPIILRTHWSDRTLLK